MSSFFLNLRKSFVSSAADPSNKLIFWLMIVLYGAVLLIDGMREPLYCDEFSFLKNICHFFVHRTAQPVYVDYPTFYSYLLTGPIYFVYLIYFILVRHFPLEGIGDSRLFALIFQGDIHLWLWTGRIISIFIAAGIFALVYRYCAFRAGRAAAVFAGSLLILSPYNFYMWHARHALPDIFIVLLVTGVLYCASRYLEHPQDRIIYFMGFLVGLAASAKLNGLLALAPVLALPWLVPNKISRNVRLVFLSIGCAAFGFFIGSPYSILNPGLYASGFRTEAGLLYLNPGELDFQWLIPALWREDPAMTVIALIVICFSLFRRSKMDLLLHALLLPTVIFLGSLSKHTPHYMLFLFPWICVLAGELFQEALKSHHLRFVKTVLVVGMVGFLIYGGGKLAGLLIRDANQDNRASMYAWIRDNTAPVDRILFDNYFIPPERFTVIPVMSEDEFIRKNKYREIVREYLSKELKRENLFLPSNIKSIDDMKALEWKYFVTTSENVRNYLGDPAKIDELRYGAQGTFLKILNSRIFYLRFFRESTDIHVFKDGSGPQVYVFTLY